MTTTTDRPLAAPCPNQCMDGYIPEEKKDKDGKTYYTYTKKCRVCKGKGFVDRK